MSFHRALVGLVTNVLAQNTQTQGATVAESYNPKIAGGAGIVFGWSRIGGGNRNCA